VPYDAILRVNAIETKPIIQSKRLLVKYTKVTYTCIVYCILSRRAKRPKYNQSKPELVSRTHKA